MKVLLQNFLKFACLFLLSSATMASEEVPKTVGERVNEERYGSRVDIPDVVKRRDPRPLINGAFGMGKNFHSFRAGYSFSPLAVPDGYESWDFYVELSAYILHRRIYNDRKLYLAAVTPFLRYHFDSQSMYDPYWDIGAGPAIRDKKKFGNIPISTHYCFHILSSFGLYPFGTEGPSLSVRWYHFSNAKIKLPNNGIDVHFNIALEYQL